MLPIEKFISRATVNGDAEISIVSPLREGLLIEAENDIDAMMEWVNRYRHNPNTLAAARKEAERFYLWIKARDLNLGSVRKKDCDDYSEFLKDPQPSAIWCGPTRPRHLEDGSINPDWRPFVGKLKDSSVRQACTQMFGLYEFLAAARYITGNPWRLMLKLPPPEAPTDRVERFFSRNSMTILLAYIETMRDGTRIQKKHHSRVRWIFSLLYLSAARRSEVVGAHMKDISRSEGKWWWRVKGKGGGIGFIPVNDELIAELILYRESLGLSALPSPDEENPLVSDVYGKCHNITASALYKVVKQVLSDAAQYSSAAGNAESAANLRHASTHWMRHTAATDQANAPGADIKIVSKNLRHSNITTTSIYLHVERNNQHDQTQEHRLRKDAGDL